MKFATRLLHDTARPAQAAGSVTQPVYQTTAYAHGTAEELAKVFAGRSPGFVYTRVGNPTLAAFERRVSALEGGAGAAAFASGMAAISASVLNLVQAGDEIVASGGLFGGTIAFFRELATFGVTVRCAAENSAAAFAACMTEKTKLLYAESIGNPKLDVADIGALASLAHGAGIPLFIDSTAATPYLVRPLSLGADVVLHSTSKAINGGGNAIGGIVVTGNHFPWSAAKFPKLAAYAPFGSLSYLARLRGRMLTDFGGCQSPMNAFLTGVGLDTLALRMERACANALALAQFCAGREEVTVNYPGLPSSPYHALAARQFGGRFGTILTLAFSEEARAFRFIDSLRFALNVSNIGDVRTLVVHPWSTIYLHASDEEKKNAGVTRELVRVSVGIEDIEDLLEDFAQAFSQASQ